MKTTIRKAIWVAGAVLVALACYAPTRVAETCGYWLIQGSGDSTWVACEE